nr:uncharacterized protein K02A2.6-like [Solanum lycopersicum]
MAAKLRFNCTNNMAEYEACILCLKIAINMNVYELLVIGDSDLLIHQVQGEWVVKNPKIIPYVQYVQNLCKRFRKIEFKHTFKIHNELDDAPATITSMRKHPDTDYIDPLDIKLKEHPVHYTHVESEPDNLPWYFDIKRYLDVWMLLKLFVQKFHKCQVHGDLLRVQPHELNAMSSPWPFVASRMHFIGPIEPASSNGHRFILVVIDYFTKWVEVASYKSVTKKVVANFVRNNLICRFGVPESIITNNDANLNSHFMRQIYEQFKILYRKSTAYHPQMNGVVEAANKNIKKILRKMIDKHRGWPEMLPYTLLGFQTTVRTSTGVTPYLLVYGTKAVIPVEVEIPSLRIMQEAELSNAEWVSKRVDQLALIDEKNGCHLPWLVI